MLIHEVAVGRGPPAEQFVAESASGFSPDSKSNVGKVVDVDLVGKFGVECSEQGPGEEHDQEQVHQDEASHDQRCLNWSKHHGEDGPRWLQNNHEVVHPLFNGKHDVLHRFLNHPEAGGHLVKSHHKEGLQNHQEIGKDPVQSHPEAFPHREAVPHRLLSHHSAEFF